MKTNSNKKTCGGKNLISRVVTLYHFKYLVLKKKNDETYRETITIQRNNPWSKEEAINRSRLRDGPEVGIIRKGF